MLIYIILMYFHVLHNHNESIVFFFFKDVNNVLSIMNKGTSNILSMLLRLYMSPLSVSHKKFNIIIK